eukprot:symbB.v1.2.022043.t1/scaffold1928.1/size95828/1
MAPSTGSRLFLYTGIPCKQTAAPSPEQSEPGLLQKPPKDPVWTQPLVESVAVVGDLYFSESHWVPPDGSILLQILRCFSCFSLGEYLYFQVQMMGPWRAGG